MEMKKLKQELASLGPKELDEATAFLFHLRHASDMEYQERLSRREKDRDKSNWLTPDEFERRLDRD